MKKQYMILKFRKPQDSEVITEFFLPDNGSSLRKSYREMKLARYRDAGYVCSGFTYVDKETYYNAKIDYVVNEYKANEEDRVRRCNLFAKGLISTDLYFNCIHVCDEYRLHYLSKLNKMVNRLIRLGYEVQNEVAIQLYDGIHGNNNLFYELEEEERVSYVQYK